MKYKSARNLQRHQNAKHKMIRYTCDRCDVEYNRSDTLIMHVRDKHEGKTVKCHSCDFEMGVSSGKQRMDAHMRLKHDEEKLECE